MSNYTTGSFTRWGYLSLLVITQHKFSLPLYSTVRTEPTQSNIKRSVDYNHALTPIQCDVPMHMQCNAPLHVISCHMYNECCKNNTNHTTHLVSWTITSPAYDFNTSFHSCQYIMHTYINIHIQHVILCLSNDTHTIKPCNGHLHI